jgi:predicted secreted protein
MSIKTVIIYGVILVFLFCRNLLNSNQIIILTKSDDRKEIIIPFNNQFKIKLGGNSSTGSDWFVTELDSSAIIKLGQPLYEDSVHRVGGGGYFTLLFKTIRISKSELQLKYGRGWDPQDVPMDSFLVTIVVK